MRRTALLCKRSSTEGLQKSHIHEKNNEALLKERRKSELSLQARDEALQAKSAAENTREGPEYIAGVRAQEAKRCQREKLELTKK